MTRVAVRVPCAGAVLTAVAVLSRARPSVSLHPSGLQVVVTFHSSARMMNILMDDIRPFKDVSIKVPIDPVSWRGLMGWFTTLQ